ncbi:glycosyltransferase (plasmid) [Sulfitobacter sp. OXR-159]|uniref:glycosyltransferase n=1 Tax=Sulfitobacter sp. OXR-159 TaxID=3100174 RepID=UPI002AC8ED37|nr:glycosyltransferase [Sulfitobacter sp. OXR-159]WPZ31654.1 glycosyltransferase [Sulfitobacter sp. OXR-159]
MAPTQSRPTIHWISPLPPAETDIAHYTARILPALSSHAEVILWTDADTWDLDLERYCTVKSFNPDTVLPRDFTAARSGDGLEVLFLNIGNSWVFHAGILRMAQRIPSVVVLHDLAIQELMIEAVKGGEWRASAYLAGMEKWHGSSGVAAGRACMNRSEQGSVISKEIPGFELVLEKALGVVTHTKIAQEAVQHRLPHLPCQMLPLPFEVGPKPSEMRTSTGPLRLLQFGWIGPNRRLEQVLDALAEMPTDFDYRLDVMGKLWNPDLIYNKIDQLNLSDRVHLHGFVPEPVLEDALRQTHLALNLRHPSMGEASGSQLRIWNAGTSAAVTREGWYAELPEEVVYFIDQESESVQLQELFAKLNADRKSAGASGAAGRAYFETHHAPDTYAQGIVRFIQEVTLTGSQELALRLRVNEPHAQALHPKLQSRLEMLSMARSKP